MPFTVSGTLSHSIACRKVQVDGFSALSQVMNLNFTLDGVYTERPSKVVNGRSTFWHSGGKLYIYYCNGSTSANTIGKVDTFDAYMLDLDPQTTEGAAFHENYHYAQEASSRIPWAHCPGYAAALQKPGRDDTIQMDFRIAETLDPRGWALVWGDIDRDGVYSYDNIMYAEPGGDSGGVTTTCVDDTYITPTLKVDAEWRYAAGPERGFAVWEGANQELCDAACGPSAKAAEPAASTTTTAAATPSISEISLSSDEKLITIPDNGNTTAIIAMANARVETCDTLCRKTERTCSQILLDKIQSYATASPETFCHFVTDILGLSFDPANVSVVCKAAVPNPPHQGTTEFFGLGCSHDWWEWRSNFSKPLSGCKTVTYSNLHVINMIVNSSLKCNTSNGRMSGAFIFAPSICACESLTATTPEPEPASTTSATVSMSTTTTRLTTAASSSGSDQHIKYVRGRGSVRASESCSKACARELPGSACITDDRLNVLDRTLSKADRNKIFDLAMSAFKSAGVNCDRLRVCDVDVCRQYGAPYFYPDAEAGGITCTLGHLAQCDLQPAFSFHQRLCKCKVSCCEDECNQLFSLKFGGDLPLRDRTPIEDRDVLPAGTMDGSRCYNCQHNTETAFSNTPPYSFGEQNQCFQAGASSSTCSTMCSFRKGLDENKRLNSPRRTVLPWAPGHPHLDAASSGCAVSGGEEGDQLLWHSHRCTTGMENENDNPPVTVVEFEESYYGMSTLDNNGQPEAAPQEHAWVACGQGALCECQQLRKPGMLTQLTQAHNAPLMSVVDCSYRDLIFPPTFEEKIISPPSGSPMAQYLDGINAMIDLSNNRLTSIPDGLFDSVETEKLKTIDLSNNRLTSIPLLRHNRLETLNLRGNSIRRVDDLVWTGMKEASELKCDASKCADDGGDCCEHPARQMCANGFDVVPDFVLCGFMSILTSSSTFKCCPAACSAFTRSLKTVDLRDNNITMLYGKEIGGADTTAIVSSSSTTGSAPPECFDTYANFRESVNAIDVLLSCNPLTLISPLALSQLYPSEPETAIVKMDGKMRDDLVGRNEDPRHNIGGGKRYPGASHCRVLGMDVHEKNALMWRCKCAVGFVGSNGDESTVDANAAGMDMFTLIGCLPKVPVHNCKEAYERTVADQIATNEQLRDSIGDIELLCDVPPRQLPSLATSAYEQHIQTGAVCTLKWKRSTADKLIAGTRVGDWQCDGSSEIHELTPSVVFSQPVKVTGSIFRAASNKTCWDTHLLAALTCSDFEEHGYTCVGFNCAAMDPSGDPAFCATPRPPGWIVNAATGKCEKGADGGLDEDAEISEPATPASKAGLSNGVTAAIVVVVAFAIAAALAVAARKYQWDCSGLMSCLPKSDSTAKREIAKIVVDEGRQIFVDHFGHLTSYSALNQWIEDRQIPLGKLRRGTLLNGNGRFGTTHLSTELKKTSRPRNDPILLNDMYDAAGAAGISDKASAAETMPTDNGNIIVKVCEWEQDKRKMANFVAETLLSSSLGHRNILTPTNVSFGSLPMAVTLPHMRNGDLRTFLRACRPTAQHRKEVLGIPELLYICVQITNAMEFLEVRKVIHRGLMSESVLVGADHRDVRLSGFGSLRGVLNVDEYVKTSDTKDTNLDIRWMAPESFSYNIFSVKSDIWSFGVVVWEVTSFARKPYGAFNPSEIAGEVKSGRRLERPENCPITLYAELRKSWSEEPNERQTFSKFRGVIELLLLEDADHLRELARKATDISADVHDIARWEVPMRGWAAREQPRDSCDFGMFGVGFTVSKFLHSDAGAGIRIGVEGDATELHGIVEVMQPLKHANVVQLLGCCSSSTSFMLMFEAAESQIQSLDTILYSGGAGSGVGTGGPALPPQWAANTAYAEFHVILQIGLGLEFLHGSGLWHGRLSSSCIFVGAGLKTKLLALPMQPSDVSRSSNSTASTSSLLRWMPPERIQAAAAAAVEVDAIAVQATDAFAFGVLVWEILAITEGVAPHLPHATTFPESAALKEQICQSGVVPELPRRSRCAHAFSAAIDGCLQQNPLSRPRLSKIVTDLLRSESAQVHEAERWEVNSADFKFIQNLGSGQFGEVAKVATSVFSGVLEFVAVKTLKIDSNARTAGAAAAAEGAVFTKSSYSTGQPEANVYASETHGEPPSSPDAALQAQKGFMQEIEVMKQLRHPNLVALLGVVTVTSPNMMVLEYLAGGSLDEWLPTNGPKLLKPTAAKLAHLLHQVALGLVALGDAGVVHRDLAARNILVDDNLRAKVADYGLSRDIDEDKNYYQIKSYAANIPLRWTAPEGLLKCSVLTDVYSFGILAFEIFSFGCFPFNAFDDQPFLNYLTAPEAPSMHAPLVKQLRSTLSKHGGAAGLTAHAFAAPLIQACLARAPEQRPSFVELSRLTSRKKVAESLEQQHSEAPRPKPAPNAADQVKYRPIYIPHGVVNNAHGDSSTLEATAANNTVSADSMKQHLQAARDSSGASGGVSDPPPSPQQGSQSSSRVKNKSMYKGFGDETVIIVDGGSSSALHEGGGNHNASVCNGFDEPDNEETML